MKNIWIIAGLVVILLSACASVPEVTSSPTVAYTFTPAPTKTLRIFPSPTRYRTPTPTLTLTPTLTITPYPTSTLPPFPTPEGGVSHRGFESISPTGKWIAWWIECREQTTNPFNKCLEFVNKDGSLIWTVGDFGNNSKGMIGDYTSVAQWSDDNKFVYLVSYPMDVEWFFSPPTHSIVKYSLVSGESSYIITPRDDPDCPGWYMLFDYAFSNDGQKVVYGKLSGQSIDFTLLDISSGEVDYLSVIVKEETAFGDISWSPDDRFFVFSAAENIIGIGETDDFSVFLVDAEELYSKRVYPHEDKFLSMPEWVSNREVQYENWLGSKDGKIILNIETGEVTEVQ